MAAKKFKSVAEMNRIRNIISKAIFNKKYEDLTSLQSKKVARLLIKWVNNR